MDTAPATEAPHRALLIDMTYALRSEFGARYIYALLRRRTRDRELAQVLERMESDGVQRVRELRGLMTELGAQPAGGRFRRRMAAWALVASSYPFGVRFALLLCLDAESSVGRWYREYSAYFAQLGDAERAKLCERWSQAKQRNALALQTWIDHMPRRGAPGIG